MPIKFNQRDGLLLDFYTTGKSEWQHWISFYKGWAGIRFSLGIGSYFDRRICITISLGCGSLYIHLPIYTKYNECEPPVYGFYYYASAFWIQRGRKIKKIKLPFEFHYFQRRDALLKLILVMRWANELAHGRAVLLGAVIQ